MAMELSENMSKLIHRMGREREDRITNGNKHFRDQWVKQWVGSSLMVA